MAELETLYVRIETDLTAFEAGLAKARTATQAFAADARSTFSGVGDALDLKRFRDELAVSEKAAKASAARMKRAFAEVGEVQLETARQALKMLAKSIGAQGGQSGAKTGAKRGQSSSSNNEGLSDYFSVEGAGLGVTIAGILVALLATTAGAATFPISGPTLAAFYALSAALGGSMPAMENLADALLSDDSNTSGLDEKIRNLENTIRDLKNGIDVEKKLIHPLERFPSLSPEEIQERLKKPQEELRALMAMKEAVEAQHRQAGETATQFQDFLSAFTELSACLRELCARIDSLAPLPSGGAAAPQADKLGFDGAGTGGGFIKASFIGDSPFGGGGLALFNEQLQVAGLRAEDAGARVAELTERAGGARREFGALTRVLRANNVVFDDQVGAVRLLETLMPGLGAELTGVFAEAGTAGRDFDRVAEAMGGTLIDAFKGAAIEGKSFRTVMLGVIDDMLRLSQSASRAVQGIRTTTMYSATSTNIATRTIRNPSPFDRYRVQDGHWAAVRLTGLPQSLQGSVVMVGTPRSDYRLQAVAA